MLQRSSVQELHGDEGAAVLLADVIYRADVWVIQGGSGSRLAPETNHGIRVASEFAGQKLERHKAVQPAVLGLVNHAHPAAAQTFDDAVMRDGPSEREIRALLRVLALPASHGPRGHLPPRHPQEPATPLLRRPPSHA